MSTYVSSDFSDDISVFFDKDNIVKGSSCTEIRCAYNTQKDGEKFGHCSLKIIPRRRGYNICVIAATVQLNEE